MVSGIDAPPTESRPLENENAPPPVACVQPATGEDPHGEPPETIPDGTRRHATRAQLHAAGVQSPLVAFPQGALGGAAQDRSKPVHPCPAGHRPVMPNAPTPVAGGPAGGLEPQAARPPCLLPRHRERTGTGTDSLRGSPRVAQVAASPLVARVDDRRVRFARLTRHYRLPPPCVVHSVCARAANP